MTNTIDTSKFEPFRNGQQLRAADLEGLLQLALLRAQIADPVWGIESFALDRSLRGRFVNGKSLQLEICSVTGITPSGELVCLRGSHTISAQIKVAEGALLDVAVELWRPDRPLNAAEKPSRYRLVAAVVDETHTPQPQAGQLYLGRFSVSRDVPALRLVCPPWLRHFDAISPAWPGWTQTFEKALDQILGESSLPGLSADGCAAAIEIRSLAAGWKTMLLHRLAERCAAINLLWSKRRSSARHTSEYAFDRNCLDWSTFPLDKLPSFFADLLLRPLARCNRRRALPLRRNLGEYKVDTDSDALVISLLQSVSGGLELRLPIDAPARIRISGDLCNEPMTGEPVGSFRVFDLSLARPVIGILRVSEGAKFKDDLEVWLSAAQ